MTVALGVSAYSARDLPPDDARVLQGAAVPRRRLGDHRAAPRAGPAADGRAAQVHADHVLDGGDRLAGAGRHSAVRGVLLEGRDHRGRPFLERPRPRLCLLRGDGGRVRHRVLLVPDAVPRVPRRGALPGAATAHESGDEHAHDASHEAGAEPDAHADHGGPPKESPWVVTVPLILLAIPSVYAGSPTSSRCSSAASSAIRSSIAEAHPAMEQLKEEWHGVVPFIEHGLLSLPFWLAVAGIATAWYCYLVNPAVPARIRKSAGCGLHAARQQVLLRPLQRLVLRRRLPAHRRFLSNVGDRSIIDGFFVNGTAQDHRARLGAAAAHAVGVRLPLRLHDDRRPVRAAVVVDALQELSRDALSFPRHLGPDRRRRRRAGGAQRRGREVRAVDRAVRRAAGLPRHDSALAVLRARHARTCSSSSTPNGSRASTSTISWASTASRCCSCS